MLISYLFIFTFLAPSKETEENEEIFSNRIRFSHPEEIIISVHTWNVNGSKYIKDNLKLSQWIIPHPEEKTPDILFFGFQEICDLSATNIMFNANTKNIELWKSLLISNLNEIDK